MSETIQRPTRVVKKGITRRSFLKTTAAVGGIAALSGTTFGCSSIEPSTAINASSEEQAYRAECCWTCGWCNYNLIVRDGRAVRAESIVSDNPNERNSRMCLRGRAKFRDMYNPNRIKYPMKRVGERGSGEWERITWDEAIETISAKFNECIEKYGSKSIAFYNNPTSGNNEAIHSPTYGLTSRLVNVLQASSIDYCTDWAVTYGEGTLLGAGAQTNDISKDIIKADKVFLWGGNFIESYWCFWSPLADAIESGTQFIVVDPNYSTSASKATWWVSNRAGSDLALILGILNYLVSNNLHNKEFLLAHTTSAALVKPNNTFMRMSDLGVPAKEGPINPATGQPTVVDPLVVWDESAEKAVAIEEAIKPALRGTFTVEGKKVSTSFELLVKMLNDYPLDVVSELTEVPIADIEQLAIMESSGNIYNIHGLANQAYLNGSHVGQALVLLSLLTGTIGKPGNSVGNYWSFYLINFGFFSPTGTAATQLPLMYMKEIVESGKFKGEDYPIKCLYVAGGNILSSASDSNKIKEWLNKMELIVNPNLQFDDTALYADILLPVTHPNEVTGFMPLAESPFLGLTEQAVERPYEVKSDTDIAKLLAEKLGVGEHFQLTYEEIAKGLLDDAPISKELGITFERLKKEKDIHWNPEPVSFKGAVFPTETGRANIFVEKPVPRMDFGQELDPSKEHLPHWFPPDEVWPESEAMKTYPLALMSERLFARWHTGGFENHWIHEIVTEPIVKINPVDAEPRGIKNGDYVEVFNSRGHAVAKAVIANDRRPGLMIYPKSFQTSEFIAGGWSELTSLKWDPWAVNISFMDVAADVRLWKEGE